LDYLLYQNKFVKTHSSSPECENSTTSSRRGLQREVGQVGHTRRILRHPLIDPLAKGHLRPFWVESGSGDAVVLERRGTLVRKHVQRGVGDRVGVELAGQEKAMWKEARTEAMKTMRFISDFLARGRKARKTRRGAIVLNTRW
jgi:hypothetical protein